MSLTMDLDPATEQILLQRARDAGIEPGQMAAIVLSDALHALPTDEDYISPQEMAEIMEAVRKADEAVAAGRCRSLEEVIADKRKRFGIGLK